MTRKQPELPLRRRLHWVRQIRSGFERRGASTSTLSAVAVLGTFGYFQFGSNGLWTSLMLVAVGYEFQKRIDQGVPLMQVSALIAVMQWLVGPALMYQTGLWVGRLTMYVEPDVYFRYALPGTAAFVVGLLAIGSSVRQRVLSAFLRRDEFVAIGVVLNIVALLARTVEIPQVPAFALHLISQVGYVGALYFLFSRSPFRWLFIGVSVYPLFSNSAESAMFHDLLLWSALLFFYWYGMRKRTVRSKALLLTSAVFVVFTLQAVKQNYREMILEGEDPSMVAEVTAFWSNRSRVTSSDVLAGQITRLNQGWIISAVMHHVPRSEPFARGETIKDALVAALVPRFIMPDKVEAGGQVNFRRFTGFELAASTSMAISPLGEAYANFGAGGGIVLMLLFGVVIAGFYALCLRNVVRHPDFLFWIPLIFYQALKAETEFATVLNQLTKGAIVAFALHYFVIHALVPFFRPYRRRSRAAAAGRFRPVYPTPGARRPGGAVLPQDPKR